MVAVRIQMLKDRLSVWRNRVKVLSGAVVGLFSRRLWRRIFLRYGTEYFDVPVTRGDVVHRSPTTLRKKVQPLPNLSSGKDSALVMEPAKTASEYDLLPAIWQELPIELLSVVLTKLPVSALKTFRSVSKSSMSPEFAQQCTSVESVVCYYYPRTVRPLVKGPYIIRPCLKTASWVKHWILYETELKFEEDYALIAADHGLFCYRVNKDDYEEEVYLVVHNPVKDVFRLIMVPYLVELPMAKRSSHPILGGLVVDQRTGSYKVVVAFVDEDLTRKTFIFDSSSESWTDSAAYSPALRRDYDEDWPGVFEERIIERSIRCGDELFWHFEMETVDGWLRTLVKYNMKLDTWFTVSKLWPFPAEEELKQEDELPIHLVSFENQVFMVNFNNSSERRSLLLSEFINLVPGMRKFGVEEFTFLLEQGGYTASFSGFRPYRAVAENGTWFVECLNPGTPGRRKTVFSFSKNGSVMRLPRLGIDYHRMELCSLAVTFKAHLWQI